MKIEDLYGIFEGVGWLTFGIFFSNFLNLIFQIYMGNSLDGVSFSIIVSFLAMISFVGFPLGALQTETATLVSIRRKVNPDREFWELYRMHSIGKNNGILIMIFASVMMAFTLSNVELQFKVVWSIIFGFLMVLYAQVRTGIGVFQGIENYRMMAIFPITNSGLRLAIGFVLVSLGFGKIGGITGIFSGFVGAFLIILTHYNQKFEKMGKSQFEFNTELANTVILLALLGWVLNWDYIIAPRIIGESELPAYAFTLVIAKIAIVIAFPFCGSLIPKVSGEPNSRSRMLFYQHIMGYVVACMPALLFLIFFQSELFDRAFFNAEVDISEVRADLLFFGYMGSGLTLLSGYYGISTRRWKSSIVILSSSIIVPAIAYILVDGVVDFLWLVVMTSWSLFISTTFYQSVFASRV